MLIGLVKWASDALKDLLPRRRFVHLVGENFDKADLRLNGCKVDAASLTRKAGTDRISEYFTLTSGRTTYVLWNNPDAVQREAQKDLKNHNVVGNMDGVCLDLRQDIFDRPLPLRFSDAADKPKKPLSMALNADFIRQADVLRNTLAVARNMRALAV